MNPVKENRFQSPPLFCHHLPEKSTILKLGFLIAIFSSFENLPVKEA